jgi:holin (3TMs family)
MGLIQKALGLSNAVSGIGAAVTDVAEVFVPNATKKMVLGEQAFAAVVAQYGVEYQAQHQGWFDRLVNGLNRLPRPALAIGTLGLFVYSMVSPEHFSERMQGLAYVPEPLWWLLGAVVSFYFGAREMYYTRQGRGEVAVAVEKPVIAAKNAALTEWNGQDR